MASYGDVRLTGTPRANIVEDLTTVSGLIITFGLLAFVPGTLSLIDMAAENVDWDGDDDVFPPILRLLASITVMLLGMSSVFLGFQYLVCKWGTKASSLFGLGITLAAWFPFTVQVAFIAFQAHHKNITAPPLITFPDSTDGEVSKATLLSLLAMRLPLQ